MPGYKYDVAISFAGLNQGVAESLNEALKSQPDSKSVYYYVRNQGEQLSDNLFETILKVYREEARYVLVIVSEHYNQNKWTQLEWEAIQSENEKRQGLYLFVLRIDQSILDGLRSSKLYMEWKDDPYKIAARIKERITNEEEVIKTPWLKSVAISILIATLAITGYMLSKSTAGDSVKTELSRGEIKDKEQSADTAIIIDDGIVIKSPDYLESDSNSTSPEKAKTLSLNFTGNDSDINNSIYINSKWYGDIPASLIMGVTGLIQGDTLQVGTQHKRENLLIIRESHFRQSNLEYKRSRD